MDNIEISKMSIEDLETIKNILFEEYDDFWNYNIFKSELENPNSKYIKATINNEIIGFAGIWKAVDDIHITNIVTKKNYRRKGVASNLLIELINLSKLEKGIYSITLEVNCKNIPAIKLYEKHGFRNVGLRKKYYNNTYDAIIMTKEL